MSAPIRSASKKSSKNQSLKRARSESGSSGSSKKAKATVPMAFFCLVTDGGCSEGYFVPLSRLPSIDQMRHDIDNLGQYHGRLYYKGKLISPEDKELIDALEGKDGFGDILNGCIVPLAVRSLKLSEKDSLTASVQCEFFALINEDY